MPDEAASPDKRQAIEQASQELAIALMDYADWLLAEIRQPGVEGNSAAVEVKESLERALGNYGHAVAC